MTTTTTTTTTERAAIMRDAWTLYRATATAPKYRHRGQFALCLRAAYERAEERTNPAAAWAAMKPEEQINLIHAMLFTAARRRAARTGDSAPTDYLLRAELDEITNIAWCRIAEHIADADADGLPIPLRLAAYRAAATAIAAQIRAEHRHPNANSADANGNITTDIEAGPSSHAPSNPEAHAIIYDAVERSALTSQDCAIIGGLQRGDTIRQIAARLNISAATTTRRIQAIRARVARELGRDDD
ncbi:MAG: hypothetical protein RR234_07645 [Christensenella sp.]